MIATNAARRAATTARSRYGIRVRGVVQGVGFRPAVFRIAEALRLVGFVRNDPEGVWIEVEGRTDDVARFPESLRRDAPALSRIDALEVSPMPLGADTSFRVVASSGTSSEGAIVPADVATCDACLRELFDVDDRRYRYPFVNCTDCGPRYTIVHELPYDRPKTTMAAFDMCPSCRAEYEHPANRRFHAEPNACPACGPRVGLLEGGVRTSEGDTAMLRAAALLGAGRILAVKGLGGYQLAVIATNEDAVRRLRERKRRPHKPFALMARDLATASALAELSPAERRALTSPARPIVLLRVRPGADQRVAPSVAPELGEIGVMLPSTPLHHLLLRDGEPLLVMTSGNVSDEPIAKDDDEALTKLADVADAFLVHDRRIHTRADDSVVRVVAGAVQPVRRARGLVPDSIPLPFEAGHVLAVGAELKSTVCLTRGREAFVSQHIGDLEGLEARAFFQEVVAKLGRLLGTSPTVVAHDLHPDYASTRWAMASGLRRCVVQHHHAHVASCMAENGRTEPVIGVAFDGTGCGPAGDLWGGEVLLADLGGFERRGHLRPIALAGGEAAIRQPWRLAVAALLDAGESLEALTSTSRVKVEAVRRMIEQNVGSPRATGAGRWFDAMAALIGVRDEISYEAQAAIELEALAVMGAADGGHDTADPYAFACESKAGEPFVIDLRPTVRAVLSALRRREPKGRMAARFYATMAEAVLEACRRVRSETRVQTVALSGGCFQSRLLTETTKRRLESSGFEVLVHRRVPPNDGGIALGQAAVAAYRNRVGHRAKEA